MEVRGQRNAPTALSSGASPRYSLERRLCGHQTRSGRCGEDSFTAGEAAPVHIE
jgi:hypothetical protein